MNKTAVHAIIMVLTTILAKVLGFCRELSLAFSYGASNVSDAYVVAFTLPTMLFSGLDGSWSPLWAYAQGFRASNPFGCFLPRREKICRTIQISRMRIRTNIWIRFL